MQIELKDVSIYQEDKLILENVNFHVDESEFVYIVGKVGSGKSSLLNSIRRTAHKLRIGRNTYIRPQETKTKTYP